MKSLEIGKNKFSVIMDREELLSLCHCIKEARNKIEDWEFPILIGGSIAAADDMKARFLKAAKGIPDAGT